MESCVENNDNELLFFGQNQTKLQLRYNIAPKTALFLLLESVKKYFVFLLFSYISLTIHVDVKNPPKQLSLNTKENLQKQSQFLSLIKSIRLIMILLKNQTDCDAKLSVS